MILVAIAQFIYVVSIYFQFCFYFFNLKSYLHYKSFLKKLIVSDFKS